MNQVSISARLLLDPCKDAPAVAKAMIGTRAVDREQIDGLTPAVVEIEVLRLEGGQFFEWFIGRECCVAPGGSSVVYAVVAAETLLELAKDCDAVLEDHDKADELLPLSPLDSALEYDSAYFSEIALASNGLNAIADMYGENCFLVTFT